jgi:hypothetical protein
MKYSIYKRNSKYYGREREREENLAAAAVAVNAFIFLFKFKLYTIFIDIISFCYKKAINLNYIYTEIYYVFLFNRCLSDRSK